MIACHVSDAVHAEFQTLAKSREMTVAELLRKMVIGELSQRHHAREQREQVLFLAIAMDGLLAAHPDPELRPRLIRLWQERLAHEEQRDAD
jgi:hypothetical protein